MKYAWIDAHEGFYSVRELCHALSVSPSGYRAWKRGGIPSGKRLSDAQLIALIRSIHAEHKGVYDSPRMVEELHARGLPASKSRVERLYNRTRRHSTLGYLSPIQFLSRWAGEPDSEKKAA